MVVALTVTPALAFILLRNAPLEHRESPIVPWLQRGYARVLSRIIRTPRPAYATVAVIVRWPASLVVPLPRAVAAARRSRSGTS